MKPVLLASPYSAPDHQTKRVYGGYVRRAMRHSLALGEAPLPPHMIWTQILNDSDPVDRELGIDAGSSWLTVASALVVYADHGISPGMQGEINLATQLKIPIEVRYILTRKAPQKSSIPA